MKTAFIFVIYKTPKSEIDKLKKEIASLHVPRYTLYFIDNTGDNRGYAAAANIGIKKAIKDGCDLFVIANPDLSLKSLVGKNIFEGGEYFDIWGFSMNQDGKIYYGGEIEKWRMSGGLIDKNPEKRFTAVDFPSGSFIFIKKSVVDKIGYWDESYFFYYDEVDYCWRAKKAGFRIGIDSLLNYEHFETSKTNPVKEYYLFKSRLKFLFKYGSLKQKTREIIRTPLTIYEEIVKRPFYLNFFALNLTSVINKVLHFLMFLVLIRFFSPALFAVYTLSWTHVGFFQPIVDSGTTTYGLVNLEKSNHYKNLQLFNLRLFLGLAATVITLITMFVFPYQQTIYIPILLTASTLMSNSISGSYLILMSIKEKAYISSILSLLFQTFLVILTILAVIFTKDIFYVFFIILITYVGYSIVCWFLIQKELKEIKLSLNLTAWIPMLKKSLVFLVISLLAGFYSKIDILLLNKLKGPADVGIYSSAYKFLNALMFIAGAYNISSIPLFSQLAGKNIILFKNKIKKDVVLLAVIGFSIALSIYFLSPIFLPYVFKGDYIKAIIPLRIIIFSLPLILFTSVALNSLYGLKKEKLIIYVFLFQLIYNFTTNYLLIPKYGFMASSWISLFGELLNTILLFFILKYVLKNFR